MRDFDYDATQVELNQHIKELGEKYKTETRSYRVAASLMTYQNFLKLSKDNPNDYFGKWFDLEDKCYKECYKEFIGVYYRPHFINKVLKFFGFPRFKTEMVYFKVTDSEYENLYKNVNV